MLPKSCRVGFSKVEITPSDAFGLAGYASLGKYATSVAPKTEARLFATALALRSEDNNNNNNNNTVIIVALDLHSTSKFIWEEACILIAKGERAKRASLDEDENARIVREISTNGYIHYYTPTQIF
jgi:hypothetical protein